MAKAENTHRLAMVVAVTGAVLVGLAPPTVVGIVHRSDLHAARVACSEANDVRAAVVRFFDKQIDKAEKVANAVEADPSSSSEDRAKAAQQLADIKAVTQDEKADLKPKECR